MGKKLYIGNLPFGVDSDALADAFAAHGTVESARVITDRETGRSKGFAFVEMSTDDEAAACIREMNGRDLEGRQINVSEARPQAPREGGRGGFGGSRNNRDRY